MISTSRRDEKTDKSLVASRLSTGDRTMRLRVWLTLAAAALSVAGCVTTDEWWRSLRGVNSDMDYGGPRGPVEYHEPSGGRF